MRRRLIIGAIGASVAGTAPAAQWTFTPSIALQEIFTDNAFGGGGFGGGSSDKRADAITQLVPGINITGTGARTDLQFGYHPRFSAYVANPSQDRVDQDLQGSASYIPYEDHLDLKAQVFANEASGNGGFITPQASGLVPRNDRILTYGGTFTPHFQEHFGTYATMDAYYRVNTSNSSQQNAVRDINNRGSLSNNLLERDANVIIGSGESFGRLVSDLNLDHIDGSGNGLNNQYDKDFDILQLAYRVARDFSVTATGGYESQHYDRTGQSLGYSQHGITWSGGFRYTPSPTTLVDVSYGRRQGGNNVNATINYDLTERTLITASYTVDVENQLQSNLRNISYLVQTPFGQLDLRNLLTPSQLNQYNQIFGQQNTLFRSKNAQVSIARQLDLRSNVTFTVYSQDREPLSGATNRDSSWGTTISYNRELTPILKGNADLGYNDHRGNAFGLNGSGSGGGGQKDRYINTDIGLAYSLNDTLTANVTYSYFRRISNSLNVSESTNQLAIGIRKDF